MRRTYGPPSPQIIVRAGLVPWPRLFQNLRASCATDWVERYPNHVVARWLGHSPLIAATHSPQARERHFEDAVSGGGRPAAETEPARTPNTTVRICVQPEAAAFRDDSHESRRLGRKGPIMRNAANHCSPLQTT